MVLIVWRVMMSMLDMTVAAGARGEEEHERIDP